MRYATLILFLICIALVLPGCRKKSEVPPPVVHASAPPQPIVKQAPPTPIERQREDLGGKTWDPAWDVLIERSLPPDMLSRKAAHAVRGFCPRFARAKEEDKRAFWAYLFQAIAGAEAGLNPTADVHHTEAAVAVVDTTTKRQVRQQGLLQLTYQDGERYGCEFDWRRDRRLAEKDPRRTILQPARNLRCGIRIMQNQIIRQNKPLVSPTSYWSTLQPGTVSYRVFAKQMANVPVACGVGVLKPRSSHQPRSK